MKDFKPWIGVDLDGTLAFYDHWRGFEHIGEPIEAMVARVKRWLVDGVQVRIVTARVHRENFDNGVEWEKALNVIRDWCKKVLGQYLIVTCSKDMSMIALWDDRAVRVSPNRGEVSEIHLLRQCLQAHPYPTPHAQQWLDDREAEYENNQHPL